MASQTTWASVLVIAPELANAASLQSNTAQDLILADAANDMNACAWGGRFELGQRYLAAHMATVSLRRGAAGQITDVKAGAAEIGYGKTSGATPGDLDSTSYGLTYQRLQKQLPAARFALAGCGGGWVPFG